MTVATRYSDRLNAQKNPKGEDLAGAALLAFTLTHHPGRIPPVDAAKIREAIPHRITFVEKMLPKGKPLHFPVEPMPASGEAAVD